MWLYKRPDVSVLLNKIEFFNAKLLGKVVYSTVPPEIKSNNWSIEETFYHPKLAELAPQFNTHAKLDVEEVSKKLGVKQKATIKYR